MSVDSLLPIGSSRYVEVQGTGSVGPATSGYRGGMSRLWAAVLALVAASAVLFVVLTVWTTHTVSAAHSRSHAFARQAKGICEHAPRTASGLTSASEQLGALAEPPNVHRAVARLQFHWRRLARMLHAGVEKSSHGYRAELKQARLSAHLLNVSACESIASK